MIQELKKLLISPISNLLGKRYHEITKLGGDYSPFFGGRTQLSYQEAYKGWVYTAVTSIATTTAKLPFHLLNEREKQIDHEYLKLITYSLIEGIVSFLKLSGQCYIWKNTIGGRVRGLEILYPDFMQPEWDKNSSKVFRYKYTVRGKTVYFRPEELIIIYNFNPLEAYPYQTRGFSDIQACAVAIDTDNASSTWNWKFFENSGNPGFILETDQGIEPTVAEAIYTGWVNKFKGVNNAHKPAILTNGLKARQVSPSQKEMDFVEQRRFSRDEILAIFKVPKAVLGLGDGTGGNMNIRSYQEIFAQNAIEPVARRIQDAFNIGLFNGLGYFEFYNIIPRDEAVVRADYQAGITTLNEARGMRGYKPMPGGDVFFYDAIGGINSNQTEPAKANKEDTKPVYKSIADEMAQYFIKGSVKSGELKIKKRDKRLVKFEKLISDAVKTIADQQEQDIISQIKDDKALNLPKIDFKKYSPVWFLRLKGIYSVLMEQEGGEALKEVGMDVGFQVGAPEVLKKIKSNIYLLSKSVDDTTKDKLSKIFSRGIDEGIGASEMKDRIKSEFNTLRSSRAEAIARTETIRMSNEATIEGWNQSGVVTGKSWFTAHDDRVSEICASLDGKIVSLDKNYFEKGDKITIGDKTFNLDYSDTAGPPSHPNCRCTLIPIIKD